MKKKELIITKLQASALDEVGNVCRTTVVDGQDAYIDGWKKWHPDSKTYWVKFNESKMNHSIKIFNGRFLEEYFAEDDKNRWSYAGKLAHIVMSVDNTNCVNVYDAHIKTDRPAASRQQLYESVGFTSKVGLKFVKKIMDLGIIIESKYSTKIDGKTVKNSRYYVNPILTMSKSGIHPETYHLFRELIIPYLYPDDVARLDKINHIIYSPGIDDELKEAEIARIEAGDKIAEEEFSFLSNDFFHKYANTQENHIAIINKHISRAGYYCEGHWSGSPLDIMPENAYYMPQVAVNNLRTKSTEIAQFREVVADIDFHQQDMTESDINEAVDKLQSLLNSIPEPSFVLRSGRGVHVHWFIDADTTEESWTAAMDTMLNTIKISDKKCKDKARLFRYPGSQYNKNGIRRICEVVQSSDIVYTTEKLISRFKITQEKVNAECEKLIAAGLCEEESTKSAPKKSNVVSIEGNEQQERPYETQSDRVKDIIDGTYDTFDIGKITQTMYASEFNKMARETIDMGAFFDEPVGASFDCLCHVTPGGDGHSASINAPTEQYHHWSYHCHCCFNSVDDIAGIVMRLQHSSWFNALRYIARTKGIKIVADKADRPAA